jgi:hypothetical protein
MRSVIRICLLLTQRLCALLLGKKSNYLEVPNEILPEIRAYYISILGHFAPSAILTVIFVVHVLPTLSASYAAILENNNAVISLVAIGVFIPIVILNGLLIERILIKTSPLYSSYVDKLKE